MDAPSQAEDLECGMCFSLFGEAHLLECGHSFCASCLRAHIPKGQCWGLCIDCEHPFDLSSLEEKAHRLRLDEGAQPGGDRAICVEHEEPLKFFCTQDKEPICVTCQDLPQHRGHDFLPAKNAVQLYQNKLKSSLVPLKEHLNSATEDQQHQQENIAELESCVQDLLDYISKEFEVLHQILHEKEEGMKEVVERMKKENHEEMEERLKELGEEVASRKETLSRAQAGLNMSDHIAFLRGIKELMRRVWEDKQHHGKEKEEEKEEKQEEEQEQQEEDANNERCSTGKDNENDEHQDVTNSKEEKDEEKASEDEEDGDVVAVDPSLKAFKGSVDFEAWREMLGTIQTVPVDEEI